MPIVRFINERREVEIIPGKTILEAARAGGIAIESPCNAVGTCGKCKVRIANTNQLAHIKTYGLPMLPQKDVDEGHVLACQAKIYDDIAVLTHSKEKENRSLRILAEGQSFDYAIKPFITKHFNGTVTQVLGGDALLGEEVGDTTGQIYGIALDIGTTTLVAELIDLTTGERLSSESMLNPQSAFAQDVLTRIHFAAQENGVATLYSSFLEAFVFLRNSLIKPVGIDPINIYEVVFSGNTAMLHMATGTDPTALGKYPYISKICGGEQISAARLGISPFGLVYLPPIISAFVGADITSGILAACLEQKSGTTLFIDIGTNGEIVLAHSGQLAATSTAAGPAFEGMNIDRGMRAGDGAVEKFQIGTSGEIIYTTIGHTKAVGICGSGLLDIVGELVRVGVIGKSGRFNYKFTAKNVQTLKASLGTHEGKNAFFITEEVYLTQQDIRQVQLAKGAIRSGITALLEKLKVQEVDVDEVLIAGSFGYHLRESSLLNIGLLSPAFKDKARFVGNTSQSGAKAFLLNTELRCRMKALVKKIDNIELSNTADFEKLFVASLGF